MNSKRKIKIIILESFLILFVALAIGFIKNSISNQCLILFESSKREASCNTGLSGKEAKRFFDSNKAIFVDARSPLEYRNMHIFGALNLPLDDYDNVILKVVSKLSKDKAILTYCTESGCESAKKLTERLKADGYQNAREYPGGLDEWIREGFPVNEGEPDWLYENEYFDD